MGCLFGRRWQFKSFGPEPVNPLDEIDVPVSESSVLAAAERNPFDLRQMSLQAPVPNPIFSNTRQLGRR